MILRIKNMDLFIGPYFFLLIRQFNGNRKWKKTGMKLYK